MKLVSGMRNAARSLALIAVLLSGEVLAADGGPYFGLTLGLSTTHGQAETDRASSAGREVDSVPIDGFPFDSEETTWEALAGWRVLPWLGVELGYRDLGNFGADIRFFQMTPDGPRIPRLSLDIEEYSLAARFSVPLARRVDANWLAGVSRVEFSAEGGLPTFDPFGIRPSSTVPFATPDSEYGYVWGFGFTWKPLERVGLDIGYRRHDVRVLDIDSYSVSVLYSL